MIDPNASSSISKKRRLDKFEEEIHTQKSTAKTLVKKFKFCFDWTIEDFDLIKKKPDQFLCSPIFSTITDSNEILKWGINLYPAGKSPQSSYYSESVVPNCVFVYLKLTSGIIDEPVTVSISLLDKNKEKKCTQSYTHTYCPEGNKSSVGGNIISVSELFNPKNNYISNQAVTILCEGKGYVIVNSEVCPTAFKTKWQNNNFGNDLDEFLENEELCDATITLPDGELKAHRLILAARSPVFKAMFLNKTKERDTGHVNIKDVNLAVFKEMLTFMYTENSPNLIFMARDLFKAADKYEVLELKEMCEKSLCANLSVANSIEMLEFANLNAPGQLKTKTLDFIKNHAEEVMKLEVWNSVVTNSPEMLAEIFQTCMMQK